MIRNFVSTKQFAADNAISQNGLKQLLVLAIRGKQHKTKRFAEFQSFESHQSFCLCNLKMSITIKMHSHGFRPCAKMSRSKFSASNTRALRRTVCIS